MNKKGFTLLEVMIAVTILAFLSIFTTRMIQQGLQAKNKVQGQIDRTSQLTSTLQLMTRDIEMAFHYRDINTELYNAAQKERQNKANTGNKSADKNENTQGDSNKTDTDTNNNNPDNAGAVTENNKYALKEAKSYTHFLGETDKLDFTSLNNFRAKKDIQYSDQMEVGYYLDSCSSRLKKQQSSTCLWRRTTPYIDENIKEGGEAFVILENVKSLKFRYLGPGHEEEWIESWKSLGGETDTNNKFPSAVEINLTVYDRRTDPPKEIAMTVVAALRFPNNKPPEEKSGEVN